MAFSDSMRLSSLEFRFRLGGFLVRGIENVLGIHFSEGFCRQTSSPKNLAGGVGVITEVEERMTRKRERTERRRRQTRESTRREREKKESQKKTKKR